MIKKDNQSHTFNQKLNCQENPIYNNCLNKQSLNKLCVGTNNSVPGQLLSQCVMSNG